MYSMRFTIVFVGLAFASILKAQPSNDICSSATDIQEIFNLNQELLGPFSNAGATGNDLNIADVSGCWLDDLTGNADGSSPQIDATVWFKFEGFDSTLSLFVQLCDSNLTFLSQDTQMAIFTGDCDTLELVACNEDFNAQAGNYWSGISTEIQSGSTYFVAVDGFNYSGFGSPELPLTTGEFCLSTQQPQVSVEERGVETAAVYPNPSNGLVSIRSASPIREVIIFDITGKGCSSVYGSNAQILHMVELPRESGFYLVQVSTDHGVFTSRVLRN